MTLHFDEQALKQELEELAVPARWAFSASCAERLAMVCEVFAKRRRQVHEAKLIAEAREYVWSHILVPHDEAKTEQLIEELMRIIPADDTEPEFTALTAYAQNGLIALAYCLHCLKSGGDSQEAAWAARHLYEAVDQFAINLGEISPYEPGGEAALLDSPVIQAELAQQARDLSDIQSTGSSLSPGFLERLRQRSRVEQAIDPAETE